jgi:hypothetical protein
VVVSWRSVAVVASRRDDGMMAVASRRRGGHGGDGRRFAATRWSQLYFKRLTPIFFAMFSHEHGLDQRFSPAIRKITT